MSNFVNPPFKIQSTEQQSGLESFGDDAITWWVVVKTDAYEVPVFVHFDWVVAYCQKQHPEVGEYFRLLRRNVKGFGPKHSKMFEIMTEEGFDLRPHIYNYIKDCCNLEDRHQHELRIKQSMADHEGAKKMSAKVASMEEGMPAMRSSAIRNIAFKDQVLELLNNEVLERYPEIFNSDPKYITELEGILINMVLDLGSKIDTLSFKAGKEG
ncbi:MAG: hypothetical protein K9J17_14085 [Flavobacteriales bacterium]|nr:hypothetical protein [Flavobacteriales bacterium]